MTLWEPLRNAKHHLEPRATLLVNGRLDQSHPTQMCDVWEPPMWWFYGFGLTEAGSRLHHSGIRPEVAPTHPISLQAKIASAHQPPLSSTSHIIEHHPLPNRDVVWQVANGLSPILVPKLAAWNTLSPLIHTITDSKQFRKQLNRSIFRACFVTMPCIPGQFSKVGNINRRISLIISNSFRLTEWEKIDRYPSLHKVDSWLTMGNFKSEIRRSKSIGHQNW